MSLANLRGHLGDPEDPVSEEELEEELAEEEKVTTSSTVPGGPMTSSATAAAPGNSSSGTLDPPAASSAETTGVIGTMAMLFHFQLISSIDQRYRLDIPALEGITQPGDIMIGVLMPIFVDRVYQSISYTERPPSIKCTQFRLDSYQQLLAIMFAVEDINQNPSVLSNMTLGLQVYQTCNVPHYEVQGALHLLSESGTAIPNYRCRGQSPYSAIIGSSISTNSIMVANILGVLKYPQISATSSISLLSNRIMFPSFVRTIPSDKEQSKGLANLILHFGWTWVGLLAAGNEYGLQGIQPIREEIIKAGACVAFMEYIRLSQPDRNAPHIVKVIKESSAKVVIIFSSDADLVPIMNEMLKQNIKGKVFVSNAGWSTSNLFSSGSFAQILSGSIGLFINNRVIPGFSDYLNKVHPTMVESWVNFYWEKLFNCRFLYQKNTTSSLDPAVTECTAAESMDSIKNSFIYINSLCFTHGYYAAVRAVAKALEGLTRGVSKEATFLHMGSKDRLSFKPWQLLHYIRNVRVTLNSGSNLYFDENGDIPAVYDIVNWQLTQEGTMGQVKVGSYDTITSSGQFLNINESLLLWPMGKKETPRSVCSESCPPGTRKTAIRGQPACCFDCVPCLQGEISVQTDAVDCMKCPWDQWPNLQKTRCLQKTTEYLDYEDSLGAALAASSILSFFIPLFILRLLIHYKYTPIVKANNYSLSCLLLVSLSLCFLCSLSFIGYPQPENCCLRQAAFGLVFALCIACILAKTIMVVFAFLATRPGSSLRRWTTPQVSYMIIFACFLLQFLLCVTWLTFAPPFPQYNTQTKPGLIIIECNEGSSIAFWTMLGYLFLLATISFIVAFLARRLPSSFNESQFITFSMLAFLSVWVSFIPASLSAQGKYTVSMEVFAILVSSWALVICMFLPKCFIIVFRPDMNSREYLMRRGRFLQN
ncbi:extracellular calcium-sensing receptor-like [Pseudophryne corroboree]|uniref:extracellular calcium-sensing receptor-like n=1 Tax=Pseudophryne corroboree TaxID=495146 RepID=UPI003081820F